jgi:hypothetical protein
VHPGRRDDQAARPTGRRPRGSAPGAPAPAPSPCPQGLGQVEQRADLPGVRPYGPEQVVAGVGDHGRAGGQHGDALRLGEARHARIAVDPPRRPLPNRRSTVSPSPASSTTEWWPVSATRKVPPAHRVIPPGYRNPSGPPASTPGTRPDPDRGSGSACPCRSARGGSAAGPGSAAGSGRPESPGRAGASSVASAARPARGPPRRPGSRRTPRGRPARAWATPSPRTGPSVQVGVAEHRMPYAVPLDRGLDGRPLRLVRELRRVDPEDDQVVPAFQGAQLVQDVQAVRAGRGPEVEQDEPAPQPARLSSRPPVLIQPPAPRSSGARTRPRTVATSVPTSPADLAFPAPNATDPAGRGPAGSGCGLPTG